MKKEEGKNIRFSFALLGICFSAVAIILFLPKAHAAVVSPISLVQTQSVTDGAVETSSSIPMTNPEAAGDTNVVTIMWDTNNSNPLANIASVTDSEGNTYQLAVAPKSTGIDNTSYNYAEAIYYAHITNGGANTVTVTFDNLAQCSDISVMEYSGLDPISPFDVGSSNVGPASTTADSGSASTNFASEVLIGGTIIGGQVNAAGNGYTEIYQSPLSLNMVEDETVSARGSYDATMSTSGVGKWVTEMAAFVAAGQEAQNGIGVYSYNSAINSIAVPTSWDLSGFNGINPLTDPCVTSPSSCTDQSAATFNNVATGTWEIDVPIPFGNIPPGYAATATSTPVNPSQTLFDGSTINFAIEWDPLAIFKTDKTSLTVTTANPSDTVTLSNKGTPGSGVEWTPSVSYSPNSNGFPWLSLSPATGGTGQNSLMAGATETITMTANGTSLPAGTYTATTTWSGDSWPGSHSINMPAPVTVTFINSPVACTTQPSTISYVQSASAVSHVASTTTLSDNFPKGSTAGNTIIVAVDWDGGGTATISDSEHNTYQAANAAVLTPPVAGAYSQIFYASNINGGANPDNVTITLSAPTAGFVDMYIHEYSGIDSFAPVDQTNATSGPSSATPSSGTSTITFPDEMIFGFNVSAVTNGAGPGFTLREYAGANVTEDKMVSAMGPYDAIFGSSTDEWTATMATFKAAPATCPATCNYFTANPGTIVQPGQSMLSWSCPGTGALSCDIDPGLPSVSPVGSSTVSPTSTTIYTLTCSGSNGTATTSTIVNVNGSGLNEVSPNE